MVKPRIIPCLDVKHGRVVKGVNFNDLRDSGDPVEMAVKYCDDGADEIVWLDIVATVEDEEISLDLIQRARDALSIPLTVGGGIRSVRHVEQLLEHGADKVSINTYGLENPAILAQVAQRWGEQCLVVAVDAKREGDHYQVYSHGGRTRTPRHLDEWLREAQDLGAGEFLLTSIDTDGTQQGYDLPMLRYARQVVHRPVIASGGAGNVDHLASAIQEGQQAVLLASLLHEQHLTIGQIKKQLFEKGLDIRWPL
ncbi:MAG: imidazole glycerol phosphate synthase subunit HisF [Firmicutes bacterium]|jgi:cyclase|uniref:Imidazole glycerol phosphate synthase subunit HisF n=1 Tax=Sulfobacillus benefaciens TaxID=453960 RepID=A0A2T2X868_9FIRM|nr:imidazole glycerol phosphate synthase subunit HisF [Bacillota bacterium]MCL5012547.1 imidazole glycerol phosphate synthase subunit HisF [Bacillota bacterium]PSR30675.1 MAG: imidazole glycerol phosphate synthase subunit HisF [Sulfobacillus benefaciens]